MKGLPSEYVGEADTEDACAMLVNKIYPKALGASWIDRSENKFAKDCWGTNTCLGLNCDVVE